jgi:hypothetical protein
MQTDDRVHVDRRHHVAIEHDHGVGDALPRKANRTSRAERRRLDDVTNADAGALAAAKHLFDTPRLIVEAENHFVDLRDLLEEIDLVMQKRAVEDRNDWFRRVNRQRPQTRALTTCQQYCFHDKPVDLTLAAAPMSCCLV